MNIKKYISNYKKKKKSAIISDILLVLVIIIFLVPSLRREVGSRLVKVIMTKPDTEANMNQPLSDADKNLSFVSNSGERFRLNDFEGKPVFLTYWATWCHHCVAELSNLVRLHEKTNGQIHFIVLVNEDLDKVEDYIKNKGYNIPVYRQISAAGELLYSKKIPASFIIDSKGNLRQKENGATRWDTDLFINYIVNL